jgi:muramoyltetrapeptide carboxypeptidase
MNILYHIDRMMMNLKRNGCFESIKGYNCGLHVQDETMIFPGENALEIIEDVTTKISSCYNFPAGHPHDNRALVLEVLFILKLRLKKKSVFTI